MGGKDLLEEDMATHSSYSCLENPMDRGAWRAILHRVTKSQTWLKWLSKHACPQTGPNPWPFCPRFSNLSVFRPRPRATAQESIYILMSDHLITKRMTRWTKVHSPGGRAAQTPARIGCRAHSFSGLNSILATSHVTQYLCWDRIPRGIRSLSRAQRIWPATLVSSLWRDVEDATIYFRWRGSHGKEHSAGNWEPQVVPVWGPRSIQFPPYEWVPFQEHICKSNCA